MIYRITVSFIIGILLTVILYPDIIKYIPFLKNVSVIPNLDGFTSQELLQQVGKEPFPHYTHTFLSGNASKEDSKKPSVDGNGFSLPDTYNSYKVPKFSDGFVLPHMSAPRSSISTKTSRNNAFHTYYQKLHTSLE